MSTGAFSTANPKSHLDWAMINGAKLPGPGEYDAAPLKMKGSGKFSTANPKSHLDWAIYNGARRPVTMLHFDGL
jgi:hypothetical protein